MLRQVKLTLGTQSVKRFGVLRMEGATPGWVKWQIQMVARLHFPAAPVHLLLPVSTETQGAAVP